jgi:phosphatidylethanolamine/phosphatidyl-N-methylethanolamine N-methyltransferase
MELHAVARSYARWAPVYDHTFGAVTHAGRRKATQFMNTAGGSVLEVGVGTGLALGAYSPSVQVTGIDYSDDMLNKARARVEEDGLTHVRSLRQMDARALDFADGAFDHVAAMHVLSVVPDPEVVVTEMARVCRPGGNVLIVNHFSSAKGVLALIERITAPLDHLLGWHSDFDRARVMTDPSLHLMDDVQLPPFGMMTYLRFRKAG